MIEWTNERRKLRDLIPWDQNPRQINKREAERLGDSLAEFGQIQTIAIGPDDEIYDGHQRKAVWSLLPKFGPDYEVDVRVSSRPLTDKERQKLVVFLHRGTMGDWDWDALANTFEVPELLEWGFEESELQLDWGKDEPTEAEQQEQARQTLAERFVVPPFSVLDARQGYWQERKRAWVALGIESELGRNGFASADARTFKGATQNTPKNLTAYDTPSVFDSVLCECAYSWFCPPGGFVLDPFAGGSVRGIVAAYLGREYVGVELRPEQVEANRVQAEAIGVSPRWIVGDSANVQNIAQSEYDFVFSCPPYYDLEVYSDREGELSALSTYEDFIVKYRAIVAACVGMLKDDRFVCFVVGDIRDRKGLYRNFVSDTIAAFRDADAALYNEAILVHPLGTVMMQVSRNFPIGRKLGKTHQNVLVFVKGDPKKATVACGPVEVGDIGAPDGDGA